ncbi:hypothetical protein E2C01_051547 [Portunus trituberculatus]|uniref:Uncharacterized protein n=1 Tax=Portunus trituberculatus TaxID=210409 RepID=A0A5B7GM25_PORTR|nr:hypothetical protein [Portunus trituberculatus]
MMEGITDQEAFLHLWQKRNLETENHDLPRRVDTMGFNLGQLNFLRTAVRAGHFRTSLCTSAPPYLVTTKRDV